MQVPGRRPVNLWHVFLYERRLRGDAYMLHHSFPTFVSGVEPIRTMWVYCISCSGVLLSDGGFWLGIPLKAMATDEPHRDPV